MGKGRFFLDKFAEEVEDSSEAFPIKSIIEVAEDRRVLIENHCGIIAYSREKITVKVKIGCIHICGCGLEIVKMTKEQVVIFGQIQQVMLQRRNKA